MTPALESLITKERAAIEIAPFLFSIDELPKIDKTKPKFHCTGDRLFRDRRDVYDMVVKLLAEPGVTVRTICSECHVTDDLVRSVKAREQISIAHCKKEVLANLTHGLRLASERVIELMPTANTRDALIGCGILGEKMMLLSGDVTARIETVSGGGANIFEEFKKVHEAFVGQQTGVDGRKNATKGEVLPRPDPVPLQLISGGQS